MCLGAGALPGGGMWEWKGRGRAGQGPLFQADFQSNHCLYQEPGNLLIGLMGTALAGEPRCCWHGCAHSVLLASSHLQAVLEQPLSSHLTYVPTTMSPSVGHPGDTTGALTDTLQHSKVVFNQFWLEKVVFQTRLPIASPFSRLGRFIDLDLKHL